jgi:hypothetical protein
LKEVDGAGRVTGIMKVTSVSRPKTNPGMVLIQAVIPTAVGAFFYFKGKPVAAGILWSIGALLLISGFLIPSLFAKIEKAGRWFGKGVGTAITWLLLVPMFYLVFVPGRLILRIRGIDPMCRKFPTDAPTYWVPRKPVVNLDEYKRQF